MSLSKPPQLCGGCPLYTMGKGFSNPEGTGSRRVLILGEALGDHERLDGLPFRPQAPAGSILQKAIDRSGFRRDEFVIYNTIQCQPPQNKLEGAYYEQAAVSHCAVHVRGVVDRFKPKVISTLGNTSLRAITGFSGKSRTVSALRGYVLSARDYPGVAVVPSYHPSFIRRGATQFTEVLRHDLIKAVRVAEGKSNHLFIDSWDDAISQGLNYRKITSKEELVEFLSNIHASYLHDPESAVLAFDIETEFIKKKNKSEMVADLKDKIKSIQFSTQPDSGIFVPWVEPFISVVKQILAHPIRKTGWNCDGFDTPILRAAGCEINGEILDGMAAWHHLQPDLLKDLQFVGSMFGARFPWDHLNESQPELYGVVDADVTVRVARSLPAQMERLGIWDSFKVQVQGYRPVLDEITVRGLPIDNERLDELGVDLDRQMEEIDGECQRLWPEELRKFHPSEGYKVIPKPLKAVLANYFDPSILDGVATPDGEKYEQRYFGESLKWCKPLPFLPNSPLQLKSYMKLRKHPIPKNLDGDETTGVKELERLFKKTKDPLYKLVMEYRKRRKIKGTYVGEIDSEKRGFRPDPDSRVRAAFTYNTGTGQLATSGGPPLLTIPKHDDKEKGHDFAKRFRRCFTAQPGHKFVELDFSAFHALTLGFEAEDPDYMRLARLDPHSYLAGHMLKLPGREYWLEKPDDELREILAWVKKNHKDVRDQKAKRSILGRGFGMGARKCFALYSENYKNEKEVKEVFDLMDGLFPKTFVHYPKRVRDLAHRQHYIISRYSYIRWFWEVYRYDGRSGGWVLGEDAEAVLAFQPANDAFGVMRDCNLEMNFQELDRKYELVNVVHDAFWFHPEERLVDECVDSIARIMMRPSLKLVNSVAPEGLWCGVEASVGSDLSEMEKVSI